MINCTYVKRKPLSGLNGSQARMYDCYKMNARSKARLLMRVVPLDTPKQRKRFDREHKILQILKSANPPHPHIITPIITVFCPWPREAQQIYRFIQGGDLREYKYRLEDARDNIGTHVQDIMFQIGKAVRHMHDRGIVHRDLKLANVLVRIYPNNTVHVWITDMGSANLYSGYEMLTGPDKYSVVVNSPNTPPIMILQRVKQKPVPVPARTLDVHSLYNLLMQLIDKKKFDLIFERFQDDPEECYKQYDQYLLELYKKLVGEEYTWVKVIIAELLNGVDNDSPILTARVRLTPKPLRIRESTECNNWDYYNAMVRRFACNSWNWLCSQLKLAMDTIKLFPSWAKQFCGQIFGRVLSVIVTGYYYSSSIDSQFLILVSCPLMIIYLIRNFYGMGNMQMQMIE